MRLISAAALLLMSFAAALADNSPAFDPGTICASIYQPVCAGKAGQTRTFPNACLAKRAGFTPLSQGGCDEPRELPRFCIREYAPVCGERHGVRRMFGNACEAHAENFAVVNDGNC